MDFSDETLMAYADDELDSETRAAIRLAIEQDKSVAERVAHHKALRADVFAAFAPVLEEPIPASLQTLPDMGVNTPPVVSVTKLETVRTAKATDKARRWSWPEWGALAATLFLGIVFGKLGLSLQQSGSQEGGGMIASIGGRLTAQGQLAQALTQQLSGAPPLNAAVKIGVSFRSKAGEYCRSFNLGGVNLKGTGPDASLAGLACKAPGANWSIPVVVENNAPGADDGRYRMAATEVPAAVLQAIDQRIVGQTMDAEAERSAQQHGWQP